MSRISAALPILLAFAIACGTPGRAESTVPDPGKRPVDLGYTLEGRAQSLAALQGRPVFLVLLRISDMPCEIYLAEVKKAFTGAAGKTRFVVLTIEPTEAPFLAIYEKTEALPFPIGIAEPGVAKGKSDFGEVPLLPVTYLIDSRGRIVATSAGIIRAEELIQAIRKLDAE